jgi:hypothetical protein
VKDVNNIINDNNPNTVVNFFIILGFMFFK